MRTASESAISRSTLVSAGIRAILSTAGQSPAAQVAAIQRSGWASSGYPDLPGLLQQVSA